jgi:2-aminoadipate transaminase
MLKKNLESLSVPSGSSMIQKLLKYSSDPEFISFALGFPSTDILPSKNFINISQQVLNKQISLQYQPPSNDLKKIIVDLMLKKNINCSFDQVFLTSGAQQGLSLVASLLLSDKKSYVLTEELAYSGFLQAIKPFNPGIITLQVNAETGIDPLLLKEKIEEAIKVNKKPSLVYLISEGHNPLGININSDNIKKIKDILEHYQIFAIEDDPYGFISYEGQNTKLKSLLPNLTFYIGSFSKILAPSLRIGWIIAPPSQANMLANIKEGVDLNISTFSQHLLSQYIGEYGLSEHIAQVQQEYKRKRDLMVKHLNANFGNQISFVTPESGMFVWVEFKCQIDSDELLRASIAEKIVYLPGNSFIVDPNNMMFNNSIRLCFTLCTEAQIIDGLKKLKVAFDKVVGKCG